MTKPPVIAFDWTPGPAMAPKPAGTAVTSYVPEAHLKPTGLLLVSLGLAAEECHGRWTGLLRDDAGVEARRDVRVCKAWRSKGQSRRSGREWNIVG
ncbi:hypothetical protein NL676_018690 [Syzygium grande]|nr:hypothetical protein NL676_018690 [Syzygium grande]